MDEDCLDLVDAEVGAAIDAGLFIVNGEGIAELSTFEATVQQYMWAHGIPNAGLAFVGSDDRLVLTRSYDNVCGGETNSAGMLAHEPEISTPRSRFRLGSISKTITGTAIVAATESPGSTLSLGDPLMDWVTMEPAADFDGDGVVDTAPADLASIEVEHLLRHRAGWNCRTPEDPDYVDNPSKDDLNVQAAYARVGADISLPIRVEDIIGYGSGLPMAYAPGTTKNYCGFSYMLLGEVLSAWSGMSAPDAVEDLVFSKLGDHSFVQGRTLRAEGHPDELRYHYHSDADATSVMAEGDLAPYPYGGAFNLENRLAGGGWVANAPDLVRYGRAFLKGDLVSDPMRVIDRNLGWGEDFRRTGATGHTGSLEGTHAIFMCYSPTDSDTVIAGACWAVLFNKSPPRDDPDGTEPRDILADTLAALPVGLSGLGTDEDYW